MQLLSDIQEHFRVKSDGELLSLASDARDMTPDSRLALLAELQRRLDTTIKSSATVQLVHGWYTVLVQKTDIRFPDLCSNCLRKPADTAISIPYMDVERVTLKAPYCRECAKKLKHRTRLVAWPSCLAIAAWIGFCILFILPRLAMFIGSVVLAIPLVSVLREASAVTIGNFDMDGIEVRFRSPDYAEKFALANNVLAQNRETIRGDFLAAIESIRTVG